MKETVKQFIERLQIRTKVNGQWVLVDPKYIKIIESNKDEREDQRTW